MLIYSHILEAPLIHVELFLNKIILLFLILHELGFSWHSKIQSGLQTMEASNLRLFIVCQDYQRTTKCLM